MRLFLALEPPEEAVAEVEAAVAAAREHLPELRWPARHTYHVTLVFLGEVAEDRVPRLRELVERKLRRHGPLTLSFAGSGAFPGPARARVLWTGLAGDLDALHRLHGALEKAARDARIPTERRRYRPHLTLARGSAPADVRGRTAALDGFSGTPWRAGEVHLVHSLLGAEPRYRSLAVWPLT